ncbi:DUF928 domain-containing protein [Tolypothrix sp. FACHB-123]|uniref:DUF928 domain-containing protein n=1 Tax=Tolypothrix sp. FACHB-123 TaxID=2692868 RepID=UPI00168812DF|nr:DUF928 domain-containing protein [Tolypothrix sp. FACHB-123]MBD2357575.1 DUF928 domain-containing protein [Tolypothrix sp. FACHB-123]
MKWIAQSISLVAFSIPMFLELATIPSLAAQAQAQVDPTLLTQQQKQPWLISQAFKPPQRGTAPPSAGGATRGSYCVQKNQLLTPLLPKENIGLTFSERPTFFWHVPANTVKTAQFSILAEGDENSIEDDVVYEATLNVPNKAGIMKFTLPEGSSPLKVGKRYHWYLTLICDRQNPPRNPSTEGWVERTQPEATLSKALEQADIRKRPALYAEAGIWHEALTSLVELRCAEPNNFKVTSDWRRFFLSVNLSQFASEPILDCCSNKQ